MMGSIVTLEFEGGVFVQKVLEKSCEKVIIGAWSVPLSQVLSDEGCRRLKDLGLDFIYLDIGARHEYAQQALDQCRKYGLGLFAFDAKAANTPMDRYWSLQDSVSDYVAHPALWGTVLRDEPGIYDLPRLGLLAKAYQAFSAEKMPVINLYPSYASEKQLNGVTYREYLQRYAAEVDVPYLSYDHYPLYGDGTKTWVQDRYLSDFETASDVCRQYNRQLWYFIQTLGFNKIVREPNEQDIRWQVYCALSFGARMIQLFTYGSPGDENGSTGDEVFELGLIDRQGEKTPRYEMVRRVLRELRQIEPAYLTCRHAGNMVYTGAACAGGVEEEVDITFPGKVVKVKRQKNYLELEHPLSSLGPMLGLTGEGPVMAGCFTRQPDGQAAGRERRAFTLVNMVDPGERKRNRATVSFAGPVRLRIWSYGEPRELEVEKEWSPELDCGQGIFVEIL